MSGIEIMASGVLIFAGYQIYNIRRDSKKSIAAFEARMDELRKQFEGCPTCAGQGFTPIIVSVHQVDHPREKCERCKGTGRRTSDALPRR